MSNDEITKALNELRRQGCAVIIVSPDCLNGFHPSDAEMVAWGALDDAIDRYQELIAEDE